VETEQSKSPDRISQQQKEEDIAFYFRDRGEVNKNEKTKEGSKGRDSDFGVITFLKRGGINVPPTAQVTGAGN